MLPVNSGGHAAYQNFVIENLRKYYPDPCAIPRSAWDIIERFWALIYPIQMIFSAVSILSLDQNRELLPVCSVPICCLLISRCIP